MDYKFIFYNQVSTQVFYKYLMRDLIYTDDNYPYIMCILHHYYLRQIVLLSMNKNPYKYN